MPRTTLYLVRHGRPDDSGSPGDDQQSDAGLSPEGRRQADLLGRRLSGLPFRALHHSTLRRAAQTAQILAGYLPWVPAHACERVADRTPVPGAGRTGDYPPRYLPWLGGVPQGERDVDAVDLRAAVDHFGAVGDEDRQELLVTHNFVIGWFVRHVLAAPTWRWIGLNQDHCGLTVLAWESGRPPALIAFNDTGHLIADGPGTGGR